MRGEAGAAHAADAAVLHRGNDLRPVERVRLRDLMHIRQIRRLRLHFVRVDHTVLQVPVRHLQLNEFPHGPAQRRMQIHAREIRGFGDLLSLFHVGAGFDRKTDPAAAALTLRQQ